MSDVVARIDDLGRPAWIALMVLGFIAFWPVGLAILAYLIWSGRMACGRRDMSDWRERAAERWERKRERWERRMGSWALRSELAPVRQPRLRRIPRASAASP